MLRAIFIEDTGDTQVGGDELITIWRESESATLWVDIQYENIESVSKVLKEFTPNKRQRLLLDESGKLVASCDSIFETSQLLDRPVLPFFPLVGFAIALPL